MISWDKLELILVEINEVSKNMQDGNNISYTVKLHHNLMTFDIRQEIKQS